MSSIILKTDLHNGLYVTLEMVLASYYVNVYATNTDRKYIGITDLCIDTRRCNEYSNALNVMTIMENKYSK